jgi:hypothetical protein
VVEQYQAASTNYLKNKIFKEEIDSKCRLCKQHEETVHRLTSGYPFLAKDEYLMRYDKVGAHLHCSICKALGIETTDRWYTHTRARARKAVCKQEDVTVLWYQGLHTDRELTANKTDIIIKNKKEKTCILIDVGMPADRNVTQKEA